MVESSDGEFAPVRQLSSREVYRNPWLALREDRIERQDGSRGIYSVIERPDYAVVIPAEDDGFHLVTQYRYPIAGSFWEFPQGCFPDWRPVDPIELARTELAEETGFRAGSLVDLGRLFSWHGASGQAFTVVLATDLTPGSPDREIGEQDMRQQWFSRRQFERLIHDGEIRDNSTLSAYAMLLLHERG
ncbi:NUDIX hydrolase [Amycolatopsis sp. NPDC051371]|uniref:NUDIX hydrolase n=1 Tax=Amycolatopsis sp. NPDC051371 TaxID=3155800 RepID=UPI00341322E1